MSHALDSIVIDADHGDYIAAIRSAQLSLNVACIDEPEQRVATEVGR